MAALETSVCFAAHFSLCARSWVCGVFNQELIKGRALVLHMYLVTILQSIYLWADLELDAYNFQILCKEVLACRCHRHKVHTCIFTVQHTRTPTLSKTSWKSTSFVYIHREQVPPLCNEDYRLYWYVFPGILPLVKICQHCTSFFRRLGVYIQEQGWRRKTDTPAKLLVLYKEAKEDKVYSEWSSQPQSRRMYYIHFYWYSQSGP